MFRDLCEAYFKTPADLEDLTLDQLFVMAVDKKILGGGGRRITGSPQELYVKGLLKHKPYPGGLSRAMRMKLGVGQDARKDKRRRRKERRQKLIAAKANGND